MSHAIKVREKGGKSWSFLTPRGTTNRLRVHAAIFADRDRAQRVIDDNAPGNPGWDWKIAPLR